MRKRHMMAATTVAAILLCVPADAADNLKLCEGTAAQGITPAMVIRACTAIIEDATGGPGVLAGAYYNRGNAYYDTADFPHAIADYDHAIRLKPNYPTAMLNRGLAKKRSGDSAGGDADIAASKALKAQSN